MYDGQANQLELISGAAKSAMMTAVRSGAAQLLPEEEEVRGRARVISRESEAAGADTLLLLLLVPARAQGL